MENAPSAVHVPQVSRIIFYLSVLWALGAGHLLTLERCTELIKISQSGAISDGNRRSNCLVRVVIENFEVFETVVED